jgi:two-component system sensor histidine kinase DctS
MTLRPFESPPAPSRWLSLLPFVTLALFVAIIAALVWLTRAHDQDEQRATLINDVLWMEQNLQFHLERNAGQLAQIGSELLIPGRHAEQTDAALRQLLRTESGLVRIAWLDANGKTVGSIPPLSESHLIGEMRGAVPSQSVFRLAAAIGRRAYGPAYEVAGGGHQFEVHVPIFSDDAFVGAVVGIFSLQDLVVRELPWWFSERYRVSIRDATAISASSSTCRVAGRRRKSPSKICSRICA